MVRATCVYQSIDKVQIWNDLWITALNTPFVQVYIDWNFDTSDLFSYNTLELYCRYTCCLVKTPDLGSLFLTFNTFMCVLLHLFYCLRAIRQINFIVKYVPSRNKVYIYLDNL